MKASRTYSGTACFTEAEFQAIRRAYQTGRLSGCTSYTSQTGFTLKHDDGREEPQRQITFKSRNPRQLCRELESIVDFGDACAGEILFDAHRELFI